MCDHPDCEYYPMYGVAPHECYWRKPGGFEENALGTSTITPVDQWPDNFLLEVDEGATPEAMLHWGACGVFYCPHCKAGMAEDAVREGGRLWHPKREAA